MLYFLFVVKEKMVYNYCNKGTTNVLVGGGGSMECGQISPFLYLFWTLPFPYFDF